MQVDKENTLVVELWIKATNQFLKDGLGKDGFLRAMIFFNDGNSLSLQCSETHYSSPRENNLDYYNSVEISYEAKNCLDEELVRTINKYTDCEDVRGYVPIKVVEKIIEYHGGIDYKKSLPEKYHALIRGYYRTKKINKLIKNNTNKYE
jgi:hypothetical protein